MCARPGSSYHRTCHWASYYLIPDSNSRICLSGHRRTPSRPSTPPRQYLALSQSVRSSTLARMWLRSRLHSRPRARGKAC